ncbi:MAG: lasso RiPP family leader peptide-containing protein [Acidimicrobiia bacterium]|nr:lasso RiPP family leader peptide-containing protein [Acidimicrobiia bacterium]
MKQREQYVAPKVEDLGRIAEVTRNGFSEGNDVGGGKSGGPSVS